MIHTHDIHNLIVIVSIQSFIGTGFVLNGESARHSKCDHSEFHYNDTLKITTIVPAHVAWTHCPPLLDCYVVNCNVLLRLMLTSIKVQ